jgi:hypothetical protein
VTERNELTLTAADHEAAFTEVSFLLEILVSAVGDVVGKSGPALGAQAGRQMARKMPVHLVDPSLADALEAVALRMSGGFAIEAAPDASGLEVGITRCAVRDVCGKRNIPIGGDLCRIFHYYLAGMAAEVAGGRPVRAGEPTTGDRCTFRLDAR